MNIELLILAGVIVVLSLVMCAFVVRVQFHAEAARRSADLMANRALDHMHAIQPHPSKELERFIEILGQQREQSATTFKAYAATLERLAEKAISDAVTTRHHSYERAAVASEENMRNGMGQPGMGGVIPIQMNEPPTGEGGDDKTPYSLG